MDSLTQALASVALSRAGVNRMTRLATPILIATALAPDLDLLSSFGGADAYLRFHRTLFHSIAGGAVLAIAITAAVFALNGRWKPNPNAPPFRFGGALGVGFIGIAFHYLLDLIDSSSLQLLWPFQSKWFAWSLAANLDPLILAVLVLGLLLPELFGMVSEEIGERKNKAPGRQRCAIAALAVVSIYVVARSALHSRAVDTLTSRTYRGAVPIAAGAFPFPISPFDWRGVVVTDNALIELDVPVGPSGPFDPERGVIHYKPDPTPAFEAAQNSASARRFLAFARFPLASIEERDDGFHFQLRDLRFPADSTSNDNLITIVDLDPQLRVVRQEIHFAQPRQR